ncbi:RHS repeat-associated core domain-containing protein [Streptomyces sp. SDT5-1]|uniref:RHS repeat-associated core domain-containing protein n=1 Tax=Streptomyces sp. SDT5-1 TaxID=3406418 RepID=UPI003FD08C6D
MWGTPFATATTTDTVDCPLRFPGQYVDTETGLHYNNQRYYDPEAARYLAPDPLGLEPSDNHHGYVSNPLSWLDPWGLKCLPPEEQAKHDAARATATGDHGRLLGEEDATGVRMVSEQQLGEIRGDLHAKLGQPDVKPTPKGDIEVWHLSDDPKATVTYRPFSRSGGATIDYNGVDGLNMKRFHIPQGAE